MNGMRLKLILAGVAVAAAVGLLAIAGVREGWVYYLPVDEFVAGEDHHQRRVRLHGIVSPEAFQVSHVDLEARFDLLGDARQIRVVYHGAVPDGFMPEREVVVEGRLDDEGVFAADTLMTKCASKYETEDGQAPHADPRVSGDSA